MDKNDYNDCSSADDHDTVTTLKQTTPISPSSSSPRSTSSSQSPSWPPIVDQKSRHLRLTAFSKKQITHKWTALAENDYNGRSQSAAKNLEMLDDSFSTKLTEPLLAVHCPNFKIVIAHMLVLRFGVSVQSVDPSILPSEWTENDAKNVGRSVAPMLRMAQTSEMAVDALVSQYPMLTTLFVEVEGLEGYMKVLTSNILRDVSWRSAIGERQAASG